MDHHESTLIPDSPQQSYPSPGSVQMVRKKQVFVDVREVGPVSQAQARYVAESSVLQSRLHLQHFSSMVSNQLHCYFCAGRSAFISKSWKPLQTEATQ